jgi:hypothetical protein
MTERLGMRSEIRVSNWPNEELFSVACPRATIAVMKM